MTRWNMMVNIAAEIVMYDNSIRWGEAQEMADLLSSVYSISHIEHCKACRTIKYAKKHVIK